MRSTASLVVILAFAGCGPKGGTSTGGGSTGGAPAVTAFTPPARYAAMFEPGRRWRYEVHTTKEWGDGGGDGGGTSFSPLQLMGTQVVTCTVIEAESHPGGATSRIACDADGELPAEEHPVAGTWTADERGLSRDGALVLSPDDAECSEGAAQQLCFAGGGVLRGWFNSDRTTSTFEPVTAAAPVPAGS